METKFRKSKSSVLFILVLSVLFVWLDSCNLRPGACPEVAEYYFRADATTQTMPDGKVVPMWGFAQDSEFGKMDGTVSVPGPQIAIQSCTQKVIVHLDNNLPEPTSIVINGLTAQMTPVRYPDGRVRSFTHETPPGNPVSVNYGWQVARPGTYLYQSGTHPAVQVQMGLYGALIQEAGQKLAYPGQEYDKEGLLIFSEIDPVIHDAVAADNFGAGKAVTSAIDYAPQYMLVNGKPFMSTDPVNNAGNVGQHLLVRFLNAGLLTHAPTLYGAHMTVIAEDAHPYNYPKQLSSALLPAGKTLDVLITPAFPGQYAILDRMLHLYGPGKTVMQRYLVNP